MVALEEIEDETFQTGQIGPELDDDDYTDTGKIEHNLFIICVFKRTCI